MTVTARPRRARIVCVIAAAAVALVFTVVALGLRGEKEGVVVFGVGDQIAMIVLGWLGAGAILWFTRLKVEADEAGIRVTNLAGKYDLPWDVVREIRFDRGSPWVTLELESDDVLAVMAVQATDKGYAVEAVRGLRALHSSARATASGV
ncbi:PH domain-containing protein [Longispora albida]|uniref:PH domain-containing protein n=1 Tax=Longispora albida TaxID=203523 RepID=UPI00037D4914|nr:PH domain-containing protein [Longispora albida]